MTTPTPEPPPPRRPGRGTPLAFAALLVAGWAVRLALLPWERHLGPAGRILADQLLAAAVLGGLPILWWLIVDPVSWREVLRPFPGAGRRAGWLAIGMAGAYVVAVRLTEVAAGRPPIAIPMAAPVLDILTVALGATARAALEEALFRGYLLGRLCAGGLRFVGANLVQAIAFAVLHAPGWLLVSGLDTGQALGLVATTLIFALIAGMIVRWRGGIGTAVALHAAVNIASGAGWSGAWGWMMG